MKITIKLIIIITSISLIPNYSANNNSTKNNDNLFTSWQDEMSAEYLVGFQNKIIYDQTRPAIFNSLLNDAQEKNNSQRAMSMAIWYPASKTKAKSQIFFKDYITNILPYRSDKDEEDNFIAGFDVWLQDATYFGAKADELKRLVKRLATFPTMAHWNATPADGQFPIIVFPSQIPNISIMAEFLASHGFVVIASTLQGTAEAQFDVSAKGLQTAARDILFLIAEAKNLPFADKDSVGVMGLGIIASGALLASMQQPSIQAYISLEGGITTQFEDDLLKDSPFFDIVEMNIPMMIIHAPHTAVKPEMINQYKYSDRQFLFFPKMKEFYFYNFGLFEKYQTDILGKAPGDTYNGFKWASYYVKNFFSTWLKNDDFSKTLLEDNLEQNNIPDNLIELSFKPGLTTPPNLVKAKNLIRENGIKQFNNLYRQLKQNDPIPFSFKTLFALYQWSSSQENPHITKEIIGKMMISDFPDTVMGHFILARIFETKKVPVTALKYYEKALELIDIDPTFISNPQKTKQYKTFIKNKISTLIK